MIDYIDRCSRIERNPQISVHTAARVSDKAGWAPEMPRPPVLRSSGVDDARDASSDSSIERRCRFAAVLLWLGVTQERDREKRLALIVRESYPLGVHEEFGVEQRLARAPGPFSCVLVGCEHVLGGGSTRAARCAKRR